MVDNLIGGNFCQEFFAAIFNQNAEDAFIRELFSIFKKHKFCHLLTLNQLNPCLLTSEIWPKVIFKCELRSPRPLFFYKLYILYLMSQISNLSRTRYFLLRNEKSPN